MLEPDTDTLRLQRLSHHPRQFRSQHVHIRLIPRGERKLRQHLLRVVLLAVEAAVDPILDAAAQRAEERGNRQGREHDGKLRLLPRRRLEDALEQDHTAQEDQRQQRGSDRVEQRLADEKYTAALAHCSADQRADLEHRLGRLFDRLGDTAAALRHYACAHELLPSDATSLHARMLTDWSLAVLRSGEIGAAAHLAQQGLHAAETAGDAAALARSQTLLCLLARRQGDMTAALAAGSAAVAAARQRQDVSILAAALNSLALVHADAGDPACAIPLVEEALTQTTRIGDRHRAAALHNTLADLHHAGGQEEQAMAQLKQAVVIFAEIGEEVGGANAEIWMLREW